MAIESQDQSKGIPRDLFPVHPVLDQIQIACILLNNCLNRNLKTIPHQEKEIINTDASHPSLLTLKIHLLSTMII